MVSYLPDSIHLTFNSFGKEKWPTMRTYIEREIPGKWQMAWFVDQGHRLRLECRKPECLGKRHVVESTGVGTKSVDRYGSGSFHSKEKT